MVFPSHNHHDDERYQPKEISQDDPPGRDTRRDPHQETGDAR
ncbi:MAG TPA: hypothetical protein PK477_05085 [Methanoregulaceae archaeon]|nr:hypothetical protein [Methanoregulaceae archaeon]